MWFFYFFVSPWHLVTCLLHVAWWYPVAGCVSPVGLQTFFFLPARWLECLRAVGEWYARPGLVGSDVTSQTFLKDGNGPNGSWNQILILGKKVTSAQNHQNHRDARLKWLTGSFRFFSCEDLTTFIEGWKGILLQEEKGVGEGFECFSRYVTGHCWLCKFQDVPEQFLSNRKRMEKGWKFAKDD